MDIYRLSSDLKFVNQIGSTLNIDERMKLEIALLQINESQKHEQILFWGKIEGTDSDYYIALGLNFRGVYEFPIKTFYFSSTEFKFAPLPPIDPEYKDKVDSFRNPFSGKWADVLISVAEPDGNEAAPQNPEEVAPTNPLDDSADQIQIKVIPKNFTELDRLAYVVRSIDIECTTLPVGALKLTPTHELRYNDNFKGLSITEAVDLKNYQHFTNPLTKEKQDFIARGEAIFHLDFLDPIASDLPIGSWSIHTDSSKTMVTVRNLTWPGYLTYHRANSNIFGYCYFGNGIKNVDLPFLL